METKQAEENGGDGEPAPRPVLSDAEIERQIDELTMTYEFEDANDTNKEMELLRNRDLITEEMEVRIRRRIS